MGVFAEYDPTATGERVPVEVRPATVDDLDEVARIEHAAGRGEPPVDALRAAVVDPERVFVVARVGGATVGWAKTHRWRADVPPAPAGQYLGGLTVDPAWRRRGAGAALTAARLAWIWQRADAAYYVVNATNRASIVLHETYGFVEVARAARLQTVTFAGGEGVLLRAPRPVVGPGATGGPRGGMMPA